MGPDGEGAPPPLGTPYLSEAVPRPGELMTIPWVLLCAHAEK
jgi:hypothetical protein